jgi:hypothetical protein
MLWRRHMIAELMPIKSIASEQQWWRGLPWRTYRVQSLNIRVCNRKRRACLDWLDRAGSNFGKFTSWRRRVVIIVLVIDRYDGYCGLTGRIFFEFNKLGLIAIQDLAVLSFPLDELVGYILLHSGTSGFLARHVDDLVIVCVIVADVCANSELDLLIDVH